MSTARPPQPTQPGALPVDPATLAHAMAIDAANQPTPPSAGFAAWAADPRNSSTVANSIVKPGQPILPPNAAQVGLEAQAQPTHSPADPGLLPTTPVQQPPAPAPAPAPSSGQPSYVTQLDPRQETDFQSWVKTNHIPFDPGPKSDYDMRGYYRDEVLKGGRGTVINPNDGMPHFPDTYKTPFHGSFSNESKYATPDAPHWANDHQLVDNTGKVVFDEQAPDGKPVAATPAPLAYPSSSQPIPSFQQWEQANPDLVQHQRLHEHPLLGTLVGALQGAAGNPSWAAHEIAFDRGVQDANLGRYKAAVIAPAQAQAAIDQKSAQADYTRQRPTLTREQIQQRRDKTRADNSVRLAKSGQKYVTQTDPDTGEEYDTIVDDRESQAFQDKQNLDMYRTAIADKAKITAENAKNHYVKGTPQYIEAQRKLAQADERIHQAGVGLGLRAEANAARYRGTGVNGAALPGALELEDGTPVGTVFQSNVRPTGAERTKADLAVSTQERINEMREIVRRRPDMFGPLAGRKTSLEAAIGMQDPDAQAYLSNAQYLTDHSAAVFGARSKYVSEHLGRLTTTNINPEALQQSLDVVERTAQPFHTAGTMRIAGGKTDVRKGRASAQPPGSVVEYVRGADGKLHPKGGG